MKMKVMILIRAMICRECRLDTDVTVGSPYYRTRTFDSQAIMMKMIGAILIRTIICVTT